MVDDALTRLTETIRIALSEHVKNDRVTGFETALVDPREKFVLGFVGVWPLTGESPVGERSTDDSLVSESRRYQAIAVGSGKREAHHVPGSRLAVIGKDDLHAPGVSD